MQNLIISIVEDTFVYVVSANIRRRHLTAEQKREIVADLLKANPERSDRATAKIANVDHKMVAAVRRDMEANGEFPNKVDRREAGGQAASPPASRPTWCDC